MAGESRKIVDRLTQAEINFLRELKLPKPTDNVGIVGLQIEFINRFGSVRCSSLFSSPRSLYSVASLIKGRNITEATVMKPRLKRAKKVKKVKTTRIKIRRRKVIGNEEKVKKTRPPSYSDAEIRWFKSYPVSEHFGKKEQETLAKAHEVVFPDRPRRSSDALAWKLMNLRGKWNVTRKPAARKPRRKPAKAAAAPSGKMPRGHTFTTEQEAFLFGRMPKRGRFGPGRLSKLVEEFNAKYQAHLSYTSIRIKCNRLRKIILGKKTMKEVGEMMKESPELMYVEEIKKRKTHRFTPAGKEYIKHQDHPVYTNVLRRKFLLDTYNQTFAVDGNPPTTLSSYYEMSAELHGLRKKKSKIRKRAMKATRRKKMRVGKVKYTPEICEFIKARIPEVGRFKPGVLMRLKRTLKREFGLDVTIQALKSRVSKLRKEMQKKAYTAEIPWIPKLDIAERRAELQKAREAWERVIADLKDAIKAEEAKPEKEQARAARVESPSKLEQGIERAKKFQKEISDLAESLTRELQDAGLFLGDLADDAGRKAAEAKPHVTLADLEKARAAYNLADLEKARRAAYGRIIASLADAGRKVAERTSVPGKTKPDVVLAETGEWMVMDVADPRGRQILWHGDHDPGKPGVLSGVSDKQIVECAVKIDGKMLPYVITDHKPILNVFHRD